MKKKPYFVAKVAFIYALIALLPLPIIILSYSLNLQPLVQIVSDLAGYSIFLALITGVYSTYKINKEKLTGLCYSIPAILIPLLIIIIEFIRLL